MFFIIPDLNKLKTELITAYDFSKNKQHKFKSYFEFLKHCSNSTLKNNLQTHINAINNSKNIIEELN